MKSEKLMPAGAGEELIRKAGEYWLKAAVANNIDVSDLIPNETTKDSTGWAVANGLKFGAAYIRSAADSDSLIEDEVRENMQWAARNHIFVPPENLLVDRAVGGNRSDRSGLNRMKYIIRNGVVDVLIVYSVSRIIRSGGRALHFLNEEVVGAGMRLVSVSDGIDTDDAVHAVICSIWGLLDLN